MPASFAIIGASLAGATAAATLREKGFQGDVTLIGAEPYPPYERPPLSKQYLRGETAFEKALVHPVAFYEEHRINTVLGTRATRVEPAERTVHLETERRVRYDKLLIATGVRNRRPPIPGLELQGVFSLRSVADAKALREHVLPGKRAVIIGMGFIGCEVAASLRQKNLGVVAIESSSAPLSRVLGKEVGTVIAAMHRAHGVETIVDDVVVRIEGGDRAERVITKRGRRFDCDLVVIGVGVEPVVDFLAESGVELEDGVLVDEYCRSTVEGIYAAGDVANQMHPLFAQRIRVEHWQNAIQQSAAAAKNMLGESETYDAVHWFWSDQYDTSLQYAGFHRGAEQLVIRGSLEDRRFIAFYLNKGRIDAAVALNRGKDLRRAMPLIRSRVSIEPERLMDDGVDLRSLSPVER